MGNFPNAADLSPMEDDFPLHMSSGMGKVKVYISGANPENLDIKSMQPAMVAEAPVSDTIQPILECLADIYSPIQGMFLLDFIHIS
jgi:hypothetical protein